MTPPTLGVLLAGGLARRMGGGDKPLKEIGGRTILERAMIEPRAPASPEGRGRVGGADRVRGAPSVDRALPSPGRRLSAALDLSLRERFAS